MLRHSSLSASTNWVRAFAISIVYCGTTQKKIAKITEIAKSEN
jgi:hypothetical protein